MNDPIRRRSPDGFDDDAIFADIVAHLNDVPTETEEAGRPTAEDAGRPGTGESGRPGAEDAATDIQVPDRASDEHTQAPGPLPPADEPRADLDPWPVHPTPEPATPSDPRVDPPSQVWRAHDVDDEVEEHFDPPPAAPLPAGDLQFWAIIAGMGGGPLLLLYLVFFNREASSYWILTAIALSVGGFALLVARMPGHHEDDDDGARL